MAFAMFTKALENVEANIDLSKRTVEAFVARFDNRDRVGDRIIRGAFAKSIKSGRFSRGLVSTKYNHKDLIGKPVHVEEDPKGLLMTFKVSPTKLGDDVLALMQDGALSTYSFKYTIDPGGFEMVTEPTGERTRILKSLELWEAGPVDPDLAVNDSTFTLGFKGKTFDSKALWNLADALGAFASLEMDDMRAKEIWEYLSDEDKGALRALMAALPSVSSVVQRVLSGSDTDGEDEGKSIEVSPIADLEPVFKALVERNERIRAAL